MVSPTTWQDRGGLVVLVYRPAWHAPSSCLLGTEVALPCLVSIFSYIVLLSFFVVIFFPELLSSLILSAGIFWRFSFTCPPSLSLDPSLVFSSLGNLLDSRSILFFCVLIFHAPISLFFWLLSFLGTWRQKTLSFELTIALACRWILVPLLRIVLMGVYYTGGMTTEWSRSITTSMRKEEENRTWRWTCMSAKMQLGKLRTYM